MTETTQNQPKKAYKLFNSNWTCLNMQYKVGETYTMAEKPRICEKGFHYCPKLIDCFNYYNFDPRNKVAEVEILGDISKSREGDKECTNKIKIVREINWHEVLELVNIGKNNTGLGNTGSFNTGNHNTGNYNTGYHNTGNFNTGDYNTGSYNTGNFNTGDYNTSYRNTGHYNTSYRNTGHYNTGNYNTGNRNTGNFNTGDCNTGDYNTGSFNTGSFNTGNFNTGDCNTGNSNTGNYNSCDYSTGFFNSVKQSIYFFNKETTLTRSDLFNLKGLEVASRLELSEWIHSHAMTEEEKLQHPEHKTTGGYLKTYTYKQAWSNLWKKLNKDEKQAIKDLPNFNKKVFKEITGLSVR